MADVYDLYDKGIKVGTVSTFEEAQAWLEQHIGAAAFGREATAGEPVTPPPPTPTPTIPTEKTYKGKTIEEWNEINRTATVGSENRKDYLIAYFYMVVGLDLDEATARGTAEWKAESAKYPPPTVTPPGEPTPSAVDWSKLAIVAIIIIALVAFTKRKK